MNADNLPAYNADEAHARISFIARTLDAVYPDDPRSWRTVSGSELPGYERRQVHEATRHECRAAWSIRTSPTRRPSTLARRDTRRRRGATFVRCAPSLPRSPS